jgi:hypothetical protein
MRTVTKQNLIGRVVQIKRYIGIEASTNINRQLFVRVLYLTPDLALVNLNTRAKTVKLTHTVSNSNPERRILYNIVSPQS